MNGSLTGAWLVGEGIYIYREVSKSHRPPVPGALLGVTLLFVGLSLFTEVVPASAQAVMWGAWGLDLAGILQLFRGGKLPGEITQTQQNEQTASGL